MDKQQIIKNLKNRTSKQNYKDERDYKEGKMTWQSSKTSKNKIKTI